MWESNSEDLMRKDEKGASSSKRAFTKKMVEFENKIAASKKMKANEIFNLINFLMVSTKISRRMNYRFIEEKHRNQVKKKVA